jgi:hypothetical protein
MEKIRTHFVFSNLFYFENLTFYGIMWKHAVEQSGPQMKTWRMHIACWIRKAINTHPRLCNTHCFSTAKVVARPRLNITLFLHCVFFNLARIFEGC